MIDDNELIDIFIEETQDLLTSLNSQWGIWKASPHPMQAINHMLRDMHTLKGNARMIGLSA